MCVCLKLTCINIFVIVYYYYEPCHLYFSGFVTNTILYLKLNWRTKPLKIIRHATQPIQFYETMDCWKMHRCASRCLNRLLKLWILVSSNWSNSLLLIWLLACLAVILMEGGTVYDLQVLDESKKEEPKSSGTLLCNYIICWFLIFLIRKCWWRWGQIRGGYIASYHFPVRWWNDVGNDAGCF